VPQIYDFTYPGSGNGNLPKLWVILNSKHIEKIDLCNWHYFKLFTEVAGN